MQLQAHGSAAYESRVQSQKQNIRKHALLYFQPEKKWLIAREEGDRASCLKDVLKTPFFLEFASNGVANRDNNHMLLEHYISQFTAGEMVLFDHDIVPFCADARENNPRTGIVRHELSACAPKGDPVRMVHCNLTLSAGSDCLLRSFRRCFMFLISSYIGTIRAVPMVSELASKKCRPFKSFFWGQSTGEFNCRCTDLSVEHSCFLVNGTK